MNGLRNKYFSAGIVFYDYSVLMQRQTMLSSVVKNSYNESIADFRLQAVKQIWPIWSHFTTVAGFILIQLVTFKQQLLVGKRIHPCTSRIFLTDFINTDVFFIFFDKCMFTQSVMQSLCFTLSSQSCCRLGDTQT